MTDVTYYPEERPNWFLRLLGAKFKDGRSSYGMKWGELSLRPSLSLEVIRFGEDPRLSLKIAPLFFAAYIKLPFIRNAEPKEILDSWGFSWWERSTLQLSWGGWSKTYFLPWRWEQVSHKVLRPDGTWAPFVGSWERNKAPDGRHIESFPYRYMLKSGKVQERHASVHVERREARIKFLRWLPWPRKVSRGIQVAFSDEVGERTGTWKGGVLGCGYSMKPGETARDTLRRMEQERRFS